ncbi:MAG: ABC transporter ATP-binding protein [Candidatus Eisenbacteria bacterium]|uniref:ABC transporter ATP-binding protein n=1 Tax=Eiseniibacteriota bacterium TaxID=2212470 RepID=A0A948RUL3_UNCEI|nr:ABC transporter ATP-binding protein [Candidatus Eisenbacteria bacterium]MBU1949067.1 ABC transporter ATP-binding protein [Candidatus Eisenbacteria bacterium]MBU2691170.1 ABC transporter ATP-binding protein [Candidatus Eisenbacteria bacterium]
MSISLRHLVKQYRDHTAVHGLSLEVLEGELFVLLGPSGSGKSTVLRMIAGLTEVDSGSVSIRGRDITDLPPQARRIGFVFQNYALFQQMTVAANIEFVLRIRKMPHIERLHRREELLELVGLSGLGDRYPRQLSGGQQQRVALARALACQPDVLLLDEPFGALDPPIRAELRGAIRSIQRELSIPTIFVTHDQEEAFALADRIGVMHSGRLLEVGAPDELYLRPQTEFVATFLGSANLMVGECASDGVRLGPLHFPLSSAVVEHNTLYRRVQVLFRPEDVVVRNAREALEEPLLGEARVVEASFAGGHQRLRLQLPKLPGVRAISPPAPFGSDSMLIEATRPQDYALRFPLQPGDTAWIGVRRIHALTHPGMSFLVVTDGSPAAHSALEMGGRLASLAHARVTMLAQGLDGEGLRSALQELRGLTGSDLLQEPRMSADPLPDAVLAETEWNPYDLVVHARPARGVARLAEHLLSIAEHHLLLVPPGASLPTQALICVTVGESAKEDVQFAGRLVRHLGAEATILTVLGDRTPDPALEQARRFLAAGERTLSLWGVPSRSVLRSGEVKEQILAELGGRRHDLAVLGVPVAARGRGFALSRQVRDLLEEIRDRAVLLVRPRILKK